jgi:YggT family protein
MNPFVYLILMLLGLYRWIVIAAVVASWLVGFNVVNTRNDLVYRIVRALEAMTEPVFARVRKILPPFAGLDLSPLVVLILIIFLEYAVTYYLI